MNDSVDIKLPSKVRIFGRNYDIELVESNEFKQHFEEELSGLLLNSDLLIQIATNQKPIEEVDSLS